MNLRRSFAATVLFCVIACLQTGAQQYAFHEDGQEEGLNSLTVNCMLQDRTGFLWVCTENGLYRFDGTTYTRVGPAQGLNDSFVVSIHQDPLGELWIGTVNNLYYGDGQHFVSAVPAANALNSEFGQQIDSIDSDHLLTVSKLKLHQLTRAGPNEPWSADSYFSPPALLAHPELNTVHSVRVTHDGTVWLGCGQSICQIRQGKIRVWGPGEGVVPDVWTWFLMDSGGRLWARGIHHILVLDPQGTRFTSRDIPSTPMTIALGLLPIVEDRQHRILTRTNQGLAIWDKGHWQDVGPANGLSTPGIRAMLVDSDGGLWLGTYGKGVQRWLGYGNWETWGTGQGLPDAPIWALHRDRQGRLWTTTESGIEIFDPSLGKFLAWHPPGKNSFASQVVSVRETQDGNLWFLSGEGKLLRYSPSTGVTRELAVPLNNHDLWRDSSDHLWILGSAGIYSVDSAHMKIQKISDPVVGNVAYADVCENRQGLWFASRRGLVHFSDGRWSTVSTQGKSGTDGFAAVSCDQDGSLWLGRTSTGILHIRIENGTAVPANPAPEPPLDSTEVMFLRFDRRGWLWIGSGSGVYVFNRTQWRHLTRRDGLAWDDCSEGAFLEDNDGSIWIGTSNGLAHVLHPEQIFSQRPLQWMAASATLGSSRISANALVTFPWTREPLQIHVATSNIEDQTSVVYKYRLAGVDRDWVTTRSQDIQYSSLPEGTHRIEIYAEDIDHGGRSPVTVFTFRIRPPWWKGVIFPVAAAAVITLLLVALMRYRDRRLVARQAELEGLVKARTEELELEKKQLVEAREALREQANRDALTGLFNRGAIEEMLTREMARVRREHSILTLVMIDLDHFKLVNDRYGHMAGDEVLREVALRLTDAIRPYDAVGRLGGEEFLLVMPEFDAGMDLNRLGIVHNTICGKPIDVPGGDVTITCSFGVSILFSDQNVTAEQLMDRADKALYKAKRAGRNRIEFDLSTEIL